MEQYLRNQLSWLKNQEANGSNAQCINQIENELDSILQGENSAEDQITEMEY